VNGDSSLALDSPFSALDDLRDPSTVNGDSLAPTFQPAGQTSFYLSEAEIHVWRVPLHLSEHEREEMEPWLSQDELQRGARFVFERDRFRFLACRGRLRAILAGYLDIQPREVRFLYGPHGKPALELPPNGPLFFNVSHSEDLALVAVRRGGEIGVDLERLRPIAEAEAIARRYFTPREHAALAAAAPEEKTSAFFRCWTRKEALLKAMGVGIGFPLDSLEVNLEPDVPPRLLSFPGQALAGADAWRLFHLEPHSEFVGALAAQCAQALLVGWTWGESVSLGERGA
jgi:4'-phosphopantetheinyl transferase